MNDYNRRRAADRGTPTLSHLLLAAAVVGTIIVLTGCSTPQEVQDSPSPEPAPIVTVPAPAPITEVGDLIEQLDQAGCDFAGVEITRSTVRKGSGTISITCGVPAEVY